jgi:hypothetical protein
VNLAVQEVEKLCQEETAKMAVPGIAVAVVYKDQLVFAAGYGVRDVGTQEPVKDSVGRKFCIGYAIKNPIAVSGRITPIQISASQKPALPRRKHMG